jgi:two-component system NtrC family sensor kinase
MRITALLQKPEQELLAGSEAERVQEGRASLLAATLECLPLAVLVSDRSGAIVVANAELWKIFAPGQSASDAATTLPELAQAVEQRIARPSAEVAELLRQWNAPEGEASAPGELAFSLFDQRIVRRVIHLRTPSGQFFGRLEWFDADAAARTDFSERLQTEKLAAIGQLVSGIAHELSNPLTSIRGYAQLLLARDSRKDRVAHAEQIYREAERAGRIVQNLLLFARKARAVRKAVQLNEVIERTVHLRAYELRLENIDVELDLEPDLPVVRGDGDQLQQVMLNLLVNAEQAILQSAEAPPRAQGPRHRIRIRTSARAGALQERPSRPRRGWLAVEVSDTGPGIPPHVRERLFEPFFTTKPAGVGTGLGLSIVFGIVQEHGGEIHAESGSSGESGALEGARFVVELPVWRLGEVPAEEISLSRARRELRTPRAKFGTSGAAAPARLRRALAGRRVLVVEDELPVAELIRDVLRQDGMIVETITDSREGLVRALTGSYDLILCDLRMPAPDGAAFYRQLKAAGRGAHARLAFVTGDTLSRSSTSLLKRARLPFLAKPFFVEDLRAFVARALERASGRRSKRRASTPKGKRKAPRR